MKINRKSRLFWKNKCNNELDYWSKVLSTGLTKTILPFRKENHILQQERHIESIECKCSDIITQKLLKTCKNSDVSIYTFFLTALKALLFKVIQNEAITIVSPLLNKPSIRIVDGLNNTKMLFTKKINTRLTFKELLSQTMTDILNADKNRNYPLELVLENLGYNEEDKFFDVIFAYKNIQDLSFVDKLNYNFMLVICRNDYNEIILSIQYNSIVYEKSIMSDFLNRYLNVISSVLNSIDIRIYEIDILDSEEKKEMIDGMLVDFEDKRDNVVTLFEEMVEENPDAIALKFNNSLMTYNELNRKSNNLANWLISHHATGQVVGLLMNNSFEMIIGILGILKAGASYLPISPEYPEQRIVNILNDSNVNIIITKDNILNKLTYTKISNINKSKIEIYVTDTRKQILDLNSIQIPDRSYVDYGKYSPYIGQAMVKNSIAIQLSRGCMYNCAYCFKIWPNNYVIRTAENLFNELKLYYDMGIRRFTFVDDLPNFNMKISSKIFQMIIDSGMKVHLHFPNGIRGDILSKEYIDLMVKAGVVTMDLALETSSPRLQKLIKKNLNINKLKENVEYIIEKYPHVILELQLLHGLPTETEEEAINSLEFIKEMKWIHFPYIHILKIYPNTNMAKIAMEIGISKEDIEESDSLGYHEFSKTLQFDHSFTKKYQTSFVQEYFLNKERLLHVLPHQMRVLTEDELVQKYDSYLPIDINCFEDLLNYVGIDRKGLDATFLPDDFGYVDNIDIKIRDYFKKEEPVHDAKRVLLLDLTQYFSKDSEEMYDVIEPPLGLMYLMTSINRVFGKHVKGKIAKSRIDFDSYDELKNLLEEFKPDVIGIRCMNYFKEFFHMTVDIIRSWGFKKPILVGGPYATCSYSSLLQDGNVDIAIIGEGEDTINEILEAIFNNNGEIPDKDILTGIDGIAFAPDKVEDQYRHEILIMDNMHHMIEQEECENPLLDIEDNTNAYLIFTSGSTGAPKGVMVTHGNLSNQIESLKKRLGFDKKMNFIMLADFTFDVSIMHIFMALTTGNRLTLVEEESKKNIEKLWKILYGDKINVVNIVPTFMETMIENYQREYQYTIDHLFIGGETFSKKLLEKIRQNIYVKNIYNIYGPTETTINATIYKCNEIESGHSIPIGKILDGYQAYILDRDFNLLPKGYIGQLFLGGSGVAKGYINNQKLTEEMFIPNPFQQGTRLYKTGDMVRWNDNDELMFIGRIDNQVKVRGHRIELDEITMALEQCTEISEVAILVDDKYEDNSIHAYVVTKGKFNCDDVRRYLSKQLPEYMIPTYICKVDYIPMNINGKVDKQALLKMKIEQGETSDNDMSDIDFLETIISKMWCDILNINHIGVNDNFFSFGGHSLKAASFISRVKKRFNVELAFQKMFEHPTVREISKEIQKLDVRNYSKLQPAEKKEYYVISSAQKRLLLASKMNKDGVTYNMPVAFRMLGKFDYKRFESVIQQLIQRHEGLRTFFKWKDDRYIQIIHDYVDFKIEKIKIQEAELITELKKLVKKFDVSKAPLLRIAVLEISELNNVLFFDMHHIISDGTSLELLVRDFTNLYDGKKLDEIEIQYKDFAEWQNIQLKSEHMKVHKDYWMKKLTPELPEKILPYDVDEPKVMNYTGDRFHYKLTIEDKTAIEKIIAKYGITLYMYFLTVYSLELSLYSKKNDIIVGTPVAGRFVEGIENTLGMFVNMLPIRNYIDWKKEICELFIDVKNNALEAYEHQEYPFDQMVYDLNLHKKSNRNPVFDTVLHLLNVDLYDVRMNDLGIEQIDFVHNISKFDLTIHIMEVSDGIDLTFEYSTEVFTRETIKVMADNFAKLINLINQDVHMTGEELALLINEERKITDNNSNLQKELNEIIDYNF